jgi:hypothetical protein
MGAVTVEIPSSHVAMVSHPDDVTQLIKNAADAVRRNLNKTATGRAGPPAASKTTMRRPP